MNDIEGKTMTPEEAVKQLIDRDEVKLTGINELAVLNVVKTTLPPAGWRR